MAEAEAQGLVDPVLADIEDHIKGLGVLPDVGLERVERVTKRDGGAVISGLGHGVICGVIRSGERFAVGSIMPTNLGSCQQIRFVSPIHIEASSL